MNIYNPSPRSADTFTTERLQCAVYLHASDALPFVRCERTSSDKVRFVFADPERIGRQLELEFDRSVAVPATSLVASHKCFRRQMSEALNNRKIGEFHANKK